MITYEDLNGFMSAFYGMDPTRGLTLLLHTPGGVTNAAESLVAYIRSKFSDVEVVVPALAMSAGTMISLAATLAPLLALEAGAVAAWCAGEIRAERAARRRLERRRAGASAVRWAVAGSDESSH